MINTNMCNYDFFTYGDDDGYGMPTISTDIKGQIKMSISITSQSVQDNIIYKGAQYIGFTHDKNINDKYIIKYGNEKLKVLYINPHGRYKQVFLEVM